MTLSIELVTEILTWTALFHKYDLFPQLSDSPNIVIAKMDATANDVPSPYEVRGYVIYQPFFSANMHANANANGNEFPTIFTFRFPTIYFSPAGQKQNPKKYEVCLIDFG